MSENQNNSGERINNSQSPFSSIEKAISEIRNGKMIIVVDDEDRENEGDLVQAASKVTPESINIMTKEARGLVCLALSPEQVDSLGLKMMIEEGHNNSKFGTNFTVSIEARDGVTSGISAFDRSHTIATAINENVVPSDLVSPGHVFPLRGMAGGVLRRAGHTEAAVDLARLAGLKSSGVICEVLKDDGSMARLPDLIELSKKKSLSIITIKDLIAYRMVHEGLIERVEEGKITTSYGDFDTVLYRNKATSQLHMALVKGELLPEEETLVRVHPSENIKDFFHLLRSDMPDRLRNALSLIKSEGKGVFVYLQPDMAINKSPLNLASTLPNRTDNPKAVSSADEPGLRDYGIGAQILADLGLNKIKIITNDERRIIALEGYGLELTGRMFVDTETGVPVKRDGVELKSSLLDRQQFNVEK